MNPTPPIPSQPAGSRTPESDAFEREHAHLCEAIGGYVYPRALEVARRLEIQRDEARTRISECDRLLSAVRFQRDSADTTVGVLRQQLEQAQTELERQQDEYAYFIAFSSKEEREAMAEVADLRTQLTAARHHADNLAKELAAKSSRVEVLEMVLRRIDRYLNGVTDYEYGVMAGDPASPDCETPAKIVRALLSTQPVPSPTLPTP